MSKILLVSWGVFPGTAGSCVIVNNIARAFGKNELLIVGETPTVDSESVWGEELPKLIYLDGYTLPSRRGMRYTRWISYPRLVRNIEALAIKEGCTAVLAIFPDEFWMFLAYRVSKALDLPFYTWFHNTYLDNRIGVRKQLAKYLQPRFFRHANINFVMSDGMNNLVSKKYPDVDFATLVHGFEIPKVLFEEIPPITEKVKFMFSGSVNESCRDACERLFKYIMNRPNSELHIFSGNTAFVQQMGLSGDGLHVNSYLPLAEFERRLGDYDIMLLPHGFDGMRSEAEYKTIFPTRTIPLLFSNRPILAHSPKGSFLTEFLLEHDCAEVVQSKSRHDMESAIVTLLGDKSRVEELVKNAIQTSQYFDLKKVSRQLREQIL